MKLAGLWKEVEEEFKYRELKYKVTIEHRVTEIKKSFENLRVFGKLDADNLEKFNFTIIEYKEALKSLVASKRKEILNLIRLKGQAQGAGRKIAKVVYQALLELIQEAIIAENSLEVYRLEQGVQGEDWSHIID